MKVQRFVGYYRLSDKGQLKGNGMERQRIKAQEYATNNGVMIAEFEEVASGRKRTRPELEAALIKCSEENAILLIEDIDRISRRVTDIAKILDSDVQILCIDQPTLDYFSIIARANQAEEEYKKSRARIAFGMQLSKSRGTVFGHHAKEVLSKQNKAKADDYARTIAPIVKRKRVQGYCTIMALTEEFNRIGVPTPSGKGRWWIHTMHKYLKRIECLDDSCINNELEDSDELDSILDTEEGHQYKLF